MARPPARIQLTAEEESTLREWPRKGTGEQRLADRARIVLLSHEGMTVETIAEHLHTRPARLSKWRQRFVEGRLSALADAPRSASRTPMRRRPNGACCGYWIRLRRTAMPSGTDLFWRRLWATSAPIMYGASCASTRSSYSAGEAGASAPIRSSG